MPAAFFNKLQIFFLALLCKYPWLFTGSKTLPTFLHRPSCARCNCCKQLRCIYFCGIKFHRDFTEKIILSNEFGSWKNAPYTGFQRDFNFFSGTFKCSCPRHMTISGHVIQFICILATRSSNIRKKYAFFCHNFIFQGFLKLLLEQAVL